MKSIDDDVILKECCNVFYRDILPGLIKNYIGYGQIYMEKHLNCTTISEMKIINSSMTNLIYRIK